jgi:predicted proteasome-type protease
MTYCVGLLVDTGLVLLSDSRTNAGVDQINTFRKMAIFQRPSERVMVLMSAGNLGITQAVVNLLHEPPDKSGEPPKIYSAKNLFNAARVVGDALRTGTSSTARSSWAARSAARSRGYFTSIPPATSSSPPSIRRTFRSASRSTANPSSTG